MNLKPEFTPSASENHAEIRFTRFTTRNPARLSKSFTLVGDVLDKHVGGNMLDGVAERLSVSSIDQFADLLPSLTPKQALSYGVNGHEQARVVTADHLAKARAQGGDLPVIARNRDHFAWPDGPGILMLDYDPPKEGAALDMTQLRDALATTCPPLETAPAIWRPSASSCIYSSDGAELRGVAGQRLYIPVLEAADIPRAGQVLFERLWLAGYGRYELSKAGAFLLRSVIDASVFQPERLDFCGGAATGKGLVQRLPAPVVFNADAPYLDTRQALPDLTEEERNRLDAMRTAMQESLEPRQQEIRAQWVEARVNERLAKIGPDKADEARPEFERVYRQAAEGGWLDPDFELTVKAKGSKSAKLITVAELLRDRKTYHEATTLDPLEPEYPEGQARFVGWLNLNARERYLQSQAHGGTRYFLGDEPVAVNVDAPPMDEGYWESVFNDSDVAVNTTVDVGWRAALMRKADSDQLLKNHYNAVLVVENAFPGLVGYNEFRQRIEARLESPWRKTPGQWTEADTGELAFHIAKEYASFTLDALANAVMTVAYRHPFNPAQDRLRALAEQWDGVDRLRTWLVDYLGAAVNTSNELYLQEIGSAWLKGVAARVMFPGCKRDDVLVLRGEQGYLKSTAANAIGDCIHPDSFTDSLGDLASKDAKSAIRGIIIAELGELASLNKSDVESIKAFVAAKADHFREAYGRGERDYPRTVSFVGTTNDKTFLKDPTGNRRWWPVTIPAPINIPRLTDALAQLLGEAARRVMAGEAWFVNDREALRQAEAVRAAHFQDDVWTEAALESAYRILAGMADYNEPVNPVDYVTVPGILTAMGVRIEQHSIPNQTRIGGILRVAGWKDKKKRVGNWKEGRTVWAWYPPASLLPPKNLFPHPVPPQTYRQLATVPPVTPCSPYFTGLVKMGGQKNSNSDSGDSNNELSTPAVLPFYINGQNRGTQGEHIDAKRVNSVTPIGGTDFQGEQTESPPNPLDALDGDARTLATVLRLYRGWAEPGELARKTGLGTQARALLAAQSLARAGLALLEKGMVKPTAALLGVAV